MFVVNEDMCSSPKPLHRVDPVTQGILSIFQIDVLQRGVLEIHLEHVGGHFWRIHMKYHVYILLKILGSDIGKGPRRRQKSLWDVFVAGLIVCCSDYHLRMASVTGIIPFHTRKFTQGGYIEVNFLYLLLLWYISCMDSSYISIFMETMIIFTSKSVQW